MACVSKRSSPSLVFLSVLISAAAIGLAACLLPKPPLRTYAATIERVDERPGTSYSPKNGARSLVYLQLRLIKSAKAEDGRSLRVFLDDLYSPEVHGQRGDTVSFSHERVLPVSGELNFAALRNYQLVRGSR
jgi:hypothetical protein